MAAGMIGTSGAEYTWGGTYTLGTGARVLVRVLRARVLRVPGVALPRVEFVVDQVWRFFIYAGQRKVDVYKNKVRFATE